MTGWGFDADRVILASTSQTRAQILRQAGLIFDVAAAPIDEQAIKQAGIAEQVSPEDIAITLAEMKGQIIAQNQPCFVIGCDQLLSCEGKIFSKPENEQQARTQLASLSGKTHTLHTAVVLFHAGRRIWHHCSACDLTMRHLSEAEINDYVSYVGARVTTSPGCYQIENQGAHLFVKMHGVYYDILGLPLLPLLDILRRHGLKLINSPQSRPA